MSNEHNKLPIVPEVGLRKSGEGKRKPIKAPVSRGGSGPFCSEKHFGKSQAQETTYGMAHAKGTNDASGVPKSEAT